MKIISSRSNAVVRALLKLRNSARERRERRRALLDGTRLVATYMERCGTPHAMIVASDAAENGEIQALLGRVASVAPVVLSRRLFDELSSVTTPTGIIAEISIPTVRMPGPDAAWCVLIEDVQDPGNLGSILRSAAAAGVTHALLSAGCADVWSPRVLRAGMGAHFSLCVQEHVDLAAYARAFRGQVVAASGGAERTIFDVDLTRPTALALGNEGSGLSSRLQAEADVAARIPMPGAAESLNVAAAAAVCLFEKVRQSTAVRKAV